MQLWLQAEDLVIYNQLSTTLSASLVKLTTKFASYQTCKLFTSQTKAIHSSTVSTKDVSFYNMFICLEYFPFHKFVINLYSFWAPIATRGALSNSVFFCFFSPLASPKNKSLVSYQALYNIALKPFSAIKPYKQL